MSAAGGGSSAHTTPPPPSSSCVAAGGAPGGEPAGGAEGAQPPPAPAPPPPRPRHSAIFPSMSSVLRLDPLPLQQGYYELRALRAPRAVPDQHNGNRTERTEEKGPSCGRASVVQSACGLRVHVHAATTDMLSRLSRCFTCYTIRDLNRSIYTAKPRNRFIPKPEKAFRSCRRVCARLYRLRRDSKVPPGAS